MGDGRTTGPDCEAWDPLTRTRLWRATDCGRMPTLVAELNGNDAGDLAFYNAGSGAQPLEVRSARNGALQQRVWFPKSLTVQSVTRTPDINGNGSHEVAVIGEESGQAVSIIRDTATGEWLQRIDWSNI